MTLPNKLDEDGKPLLSWAARDEHKGVVKLLLRRDDLDPNKPDKYGRALLELAIYLE